MTNPDNSSCCIESPGSGLSKGVLYVALGALLFSLSSALVKLAGHNLPAMEIVFGRSIFGLVLCWWLMRRAGVGGLGNNKRILGLRGLLGAGGLICSFYAITHMPLADAIVLFYCNPVFAVVMSFFFLGERLSRRAALCIPLCIIGVVLITRPAFIFGAGGTDISAYVYLIALASAAFAGGAYVCMHHLGGHEHPLTIVLYLYVVALPVSFLGMLPTWVTPSWTEVLILVGIGVLTQFAQMCLAKGLELESTGTATATGTLQVVFTAVWGMLLFGEFPAWTAYAGAALLVLSTLILAGTFRIPKLDAPTC